jgi:hypothetical protein
MLSTQSDTTIYLLLYYYILLVLVSMEHHQANIYEKLKMLVHVLHKYQFYWFPFTIINF